MAGRPVPNGHMGLLPGGDILCASQEAYVDSMTWLQAPLQPQNAASYTAAPTDETLFFGYHMSLMSDGELTCGSQEAFVDSVPWAQFSPRLPYPLTYTNSTAMPDDLSHT